MYEGCVLNPDPALVVQWLAPIADSIGEDWDRVIGINLRGWSHYTGHWPTRHPRMVKNTRVTQNR
jgi:hypothetical protein